MLILEEIQYLIEALKPSNKAISKAKRAAQSTQSAASQFFGGGSNIVGNIAAKRKAAANFNKLSANATRNTANAAASATNAATNNATPPAAAARGKIGDIVDKIKSSKTAKYSLGGAAGIGVGGYVYNKYQNTKENAKVAEAPFNIADHKGKIAGGIAATGVGAYLLNKRRGG